MIPQEWLLKAIWADYSLAVALTVVVPLALLVWAFAVGLGPPDPASDCLLAGV